MAFVTVQDLGSGTAALGATVSVTVPDHSVVLLFTGSERGLEGVFPYSGGEFWDNDGEGQWGGVNPCKVMETGGGLSFQMYADASFSTGSPAFIVAYRVLAVVRPEGWSVLSSTWQGYERGGVDLERISGYNGVVNTYPGAALTVAVVHRLCDWGTTPPFYRDGACPNPGVITADAEDLGGFIATVTQDPYYVQGSDMVSIYYRLQETAWTASSPGVDYSDPTDYDTFLGRTIAQWGPGNGIANRISHDRKRDTLRVTAFVTQAGVLHAARFTDTDASAGSVVVQSSGVLTCSCFVTRDNLVWIFCIHEEIFKYTRSRDGGATWAAMTTIASGYQASVVEHDPSSGIIVAALYVLSEAKWYVSVSTASDPSTWSTPTTLTTSAKASGSLLRRRDGVWEFNYVNTSDTASIKRARDVSVTSGGSWS